MFTFFYFYIKDKIQNLTQRKYSTHQVVSWITDSGMALPDTSGSTSCSKGFVGNCISGGGGEPPTAGLGLRLGEREALRFLSRFAGDLRRGDGDLVFRLERQKVN